MVLSQGDERGDYVEAFLAAGRRLGATAMHLRLPYVSSASGGEVGVWTVGSTPLSGNGRRRDAVARRHHHRHALPAVLAELVALQQSGARILTCIEPVDVLGRLFPTEELRRCVDVAVERLEAARTLRFTNAAGTDVTYQLGRYPVQPQYGIADRPGAWDHWPSGGMLLTAGADDGVDGRVVVAAGDIILPLRSTPRPRSS